MIQKKSIRIIGLCTSIFFTGMLLLMVNSSCQKEDDGIALKKKKEKGTPSLSESILPWRVYVGGDPPCRSWLEASCYPIDIIITGNQDFISLVGKSSDDVANYFNGTDWQDEDEVPQFEYKPTVLNKLQYGECIITDSLGEIYDRYFVREVTDTSNYIAAVPYEK